MSHYYELPTPGDLTIEMVTESYGILTKKDFSKNNQAILFNHAFVIGGVTGRLLVGMPVHENFGAVDPRTLEEQKKAAIAVLDSPECKKLEKEYENVIALNKRFGGESGDVFGASGLDDSGLDPATIIMFIEMAMKFIAAWRKRRNP